MPLLCCNTAGRFSVFVGFSVFTIVFLFYAYVWIKPQVVVVPSCSPVIHSRHSITHCYNATGDYEYQYIDFANYSNNVSGFPYVVVPDIVHLIYFRQREIDFVQMITIRSIIDNHNPARILIHCSHCINNTLEGKYWDMLGDYYRHVIEVVAMKEPIEIFGNKLSCVQHASDVARIKILMKYGGIFLDNDIYVVKGLHGFRHYEMALGWDKLYIGTQVLIAHKDARFLKLWLNSYHNYQGDKWYFNAGEYPSTSVLHKRPELVHRVRQLFGVHDLRQKLYQSNWPRWVDQYAIHLLIRHIPNGKTFNENNIKTFSKTFGQMARFILYGSTDIIN